MVTQKKKMVEMVAVLGNDHDLLVVGTLVIEKHNFFILFFSNMFKRK